MRWIRNRRRMKNIAKMHRRILSGDKPFDTYRLQKLINGDKTKGDK